MARSIGLKQDTLMYKVRVYSQNQYHERLAGDRIYGAYETIGAARCVGSNKMRWRKQIQRWNEERTEVKTGVTWHYEIITGRLVWHEGDK